MDVENKNFPDLEYRKLDKTDLSYHVTHEVLPNFGRVIWHYKFENSIEIMVSKDKDNPTFSVSYLRNGEPIQRPTSAPKRKEIDKKFIEFYGRK